MKDQKLPALGAPSFESLKCINNFGAEYWSARDLQPLLGYNQWRRFEESINRAVISCKQSGNEPADHFAGAGKMVGLGKGGEREVPDYHLSRFACYLIAQNGDPRKPEIANTQKYFAIQTHRQELTDQMRSAGYKGLYGGLDREQIGVKKKFSAKENPMARMNTLELAANLFLITQTRDKLARDGIQDPKKIVQSCEQIGKEVRRAIKRIGGELPEDISPFDSAVIRKDSENELVTHGGNA